VFRLAKDCEGVVDRWINCFDSHWSKVSGSEDFEKVNNFTMDRCRLLLTQDSISIDHRCPAIVISWKKPKETADKPT
jgi:hypothetical protein